mgnify:CR=1 FL=1
MKKTIILICTLLILMSANPVQAKAHEPTGDQISVSSRISCEYTLLYRPWVVL